MATERAPTAANLLTGERCERLRELFDLALEQSEGARAGWIEARVPDPDDRAALLLLLAAEAGAGPLDTPSAERDARITPKQALPAVGLIGQRIGAFRLLRLLGEGGMAAVFLAEREGADFHQQVAIKLLRRGLYSEVEQRLFRREQQALAALSHPNIAHLIDGGVTEAGIPYLVLEYVDGMTITQHVIERQLALRARLRLFVEACRAVAAAHRQLIVHRDLKPSNILVDAGGQVKLLDFGIAKLLAEGEDGATRTGLAALTPDYAAPEQFAGDVITTATDVYALGVVLHELLLGERPLDAEARRPSSRIDALVTDLWSLPMPRTALRSALKGDLDNIVLKALATEPERRYGNAADLADDVERHLAAQPVRAHPPSRWYRTRKFVQRHRGGVVLTAAFALGLIASLGLALWQAHIARMQTTVARNQAERATEVQTFVEGLFEPLEEGRAAGQAPSLSELVQRGRQRIEQRYPENPQVRADLLAMFARINDSLGETQSNRELAAAAWHANADAYGPDDLRTLNARALHAGVLRKLGEMEAAQVEYEAVRKAMQAAGVRGVDYAAVLGVLADMARERGIDGAQSVSLQLEVLREVEADPLARPEDLASTYNSLGVASRYDNDFEKALSWYQKALAINQAIRADSVSTAINLLNIGDLHHKLGRWHQALATMDQALAVFARIPIDHHAALVGLLFRRCNLETVLERFQQALSTCDCAVALAQQVHGGSHYNNVMAFAERATLRFSLGRTDQAMADIQQAQDIARQLPGDPVRFLRLVDEARVNHRRLQRDYVALRDSVLDSLSPPQQRASTGGSAAQWAMLALACRRAPDARCGDHLRARAEQVLAVTPPSNRRRLLALLALAEVDLLDGQPQRVIDHLDPALALLDPAVDGQHSWVAEAHLLLARAQIQTGNTTAARDHRARAARIIDALPAGHPLRGDP